MAAVPLDDLTNLLEVLEERDQVGSLIVTTQYPPADWHRLIPDPTLADAICDRLVHTPPSSSGCRATRSARPATRAQPSSRTVSHNAAPARSALGLRTSLAPPSADDAPVRARPHLAAGVAIMD
jgi:hypothetical protein